jgi:transcriptional regulator with XRE-family HTH domain
VASQKSTSLKFAELLRSHREKAGLSQEELADRAGLHRTFISQVERGLKSPSLNSLVAISTALELKLPKLLNGIDD